tara:strand:- start:884 stop:991 length:108 start_codon:yes stop_codon:yes gene_type:complete
MGAMRAGDLLASQHVVNLKNSLAIGAAELHGKVNG